VHARFGKHIKYFLIATDDHSSLLIHTLSGLRRKVQEEFDNRH